MLLGKVFKIPLRERDLGSKDDFGTCEKASRQNLPIDFSGVLTILLDGDDITELARLALNLDAVMEELLKSGEVKDRVIHGDRAVDVELVERFAGSGILSGGGSFRLFEYKTC